MNNAQYLNEVQKALKKDTTRLGEVYRLVKKGKSLTRDCRGTKRFELACCLLLLDYLIFANCEGKQ